ncbi:esterase-like activity of phytase family protein [Merismopedia glauca]|uniref:PEP-CTERM sorting domain-containing protein n=1 Tax=Merismopedia glauca CCAP 1448/3 TaxID=1296344 RepID=A0A2T1C607_9CYAN|nr:esterase-like activity of phytase family protein [Merismopedia glauca]PSB03722.1 PEP-CTERM sorting domain-containing protein [Merismopedia glauca CCAP 1448/3]
MISNKYRVNLKAIALSTVLFSAISSTPSQAANITSLDFIGQATVATRTQFQGTEIGGLSGITYNSHTNKYYAISDDRSTINPARFYTLDIDLSSGSLTSSNINFTSVTNLTQPDDSVFAPNSLDPEGIALLGNSIFVSSEGEVSSNRIINPFINQFDLATGQQIQALPIANKFLPLPLTIPTERGIRNNLALESLTITEDRQYLFSATENALVQDGNEASLTDGSPSRILKYDLTTGQPIAEYLYQTEPIFSDSNPPGGFKTNGLVELLALDNNGNCFLSMERAFAAGVGNSVKIYESCIGNATNIVNIPSLNANGTNDITPVQKRLLLDLSTLGLKLDNLEGITFGSNLPDGRRSLIIVSDNNFSTSQETQFLAFAVNQTSVPEPSGIVGISMLVAWGWWKRRK